MTELNVEVEVEVGIQKGEGISSKGRHLYIWGGWPSAVKAQHALSLSPLCGGDVTAGRARRSEYVSAFSLRPK